MVIVDNAPGGKVEYRRALASSFLFKFFVGTSLALEKDTQVREGGGRGKGDQEEADWMRGEGGK